ncbi:MAG: 3-ketoacyl-ACP reductase [Proteobacteria bacterium]|nr:MAG: 3-ketoacyl-ACP reductase [Pseudomonadota bacterium]
MESIKGKNAIITGAGKGIGRAIAIALAQEGVNVGLLARTLSDLEKLAEELKQYEVKVSIATVDVANIDAVNAAVLKVKNELGSIDILINNAGTASFAKFLELEPSRWEEILKINLFGAYYTARAVLPEMIEKQSGDIINISSTAGKNGAAVTSAYSASKFALIGMSESLMQEVRKHNIRVSTLTPSTVASDMAKELKLTLSDEDRKYWGTDVPAESSSAPRMHLWEQAAIASKLIEVNAVSTIALEFSFDDLHGPRPKKEVTAQGEIIGKVLNRLIDRLKETKVEGGTLFDQTMIMLNTTDGGRTPAVDSYGDSGKNSMILIGPMVKGGYYGDVKVAATNGNKHDYSYHKPNYKTGQTEANGARDNSNRIPGSVAYRTILTAMGAPVDMYKKFPDVGEGEHLSCMLKA